MLYVVIEGSGLIPTGSLDESVTGRFIPQQRTFPFPLPLETSRDAEPQRTPVRYTLGQRQEEPDRRQDTPRNLRRRF
jgi:hypothetical protein